VGGDKAGEIRELNDTYQRVREKGSMLRSLYIETEYLNKNREERRKKRKTLDINIRERREERARMRR
jgi:hypothetical protein